MEKYFLFLKKPFSFHGRFNKIQYLICLVVTIVLIFIIWGIASLIVMDYGWYIWKFLLLAIIPISLPPTLFLIASGTKRSHDIGDSGILQIALPIYIWVLLFKNSEQADNLYGEYIFSDIKVMDNKNNIETMVSDICPQCKNPNTKLSTTCEWCGNQIA